MKTNSTTILKMTAINVTVIFVFLVDFILRADHFAIDVSFAAVHFLLAGCALVVVHPDLEHHLRHPDSATDRILPLPPDRVPAFSTRVSPRRLAFSPSVHD